MTPIARELLGILTPPPASFFRPINPANHEHHGQAVPTAKAKKDVIIADLLAAIDKIGRQASSTEINALRQTTGHAPGASLRALASGGIIFCRQAKNPDTGKMIYLYGKSEWFPSKKEVSAQTQKAKSDKVRALNHDALRRLGRPSSLTNIATARGVSAGSLLVVLRKDPDLIRIYGIDDTKKSRPLWWFKEEKT